MHAIEPTSRASLVESIHAPWAATVADCLERWRRLDDRTRSQAYLVIERDGHGLRRTLNGAAIAELADRGGRPTS